uniref:Uncharacterized protein n=1 Tax=Amphimedon queenslandica TaxID=400682 RepID=A0A1X7SRK6_AMPQE
MDESIDGVSERAKKWCGSQSRKIVWQQKQGVGVAGSVGVGVARRALMCLGSERRDICVSRER